MSFEPLIRQQVGQIVRSLAGESHQQIAHVGKRFHLVRLRTGHDAIENRGGFPTVVAAQKHPDGMTFGLDDLACLVQAEIVGPHFFVLATPDE